MEHRSIVTWRDRKRETDEREKESESEKERDSGKLKGQRGSYSTALLHACRRRDAWNTNLSFIIVLAPRKCREKM